MVSQFYPSYHNFVELFLSHCKLLQSIRHRLIQEIFEQSAKMKVIGHFDNVLTRLHVRYFLILPENILVVVDYHIPNPFRLLLNWDQSMLELQLCQIDKFLINTK